IFNYCMFNAMKLVFKFQLRNEAAFFACIHSGTQRIEEQMYRIRFLNQTVKMISINAVVFKKSVQTEMLSDIIRKISILGISERQFSFIYGKHNHIFKIQKSVSKSPINCNPCKGSP